MTISWLGIFKKIMYPSIKSLIPEFLAFCYWHNWLVIGLRVVQFKGDRARNFKSLAQLFPELYSSPIIITSSNLTQPPRQPLRSSS